ncbi:MAG: DNA replication/repair protein RecF [Lactobacillaceae bacterium]|jgi:DNA replication and repair protein RecF|nr:DNA replication/repair protein RecF [Lactobacillaceae bacterium]
MEIKNIQLKNYRNYSVLNLDFSPHINIFVGENAQGKTNLLESIYLLSLAVSHRTNDAKRLVKWDEKISDVKASINRTTGSLLLEVLINKDGTKVAKVNNLTEKRLTNYVGNLNVVLFAPEDLDIVKGSPSVRRNFMDSEFGQMNKQYLFNLTNFRKVLKNRNAYLKEVEQIDLDYLDVLNFQLADLGAKVIKQRFEFVAQLTDIANNIHGSIADSETLTIKYKTLRGIDENSTVQEISDNYFDLLKKNLERDRFMKSTTTGPHHDDLIFFINDREVGIYASQGQQRTTALSLRLAEIELINRQTGQYPVLLLDDVFSELDSTRQTQLIKFIQDKVQTFITTPSLNDIEKRLIDDPKIFNVRNGEIING